MVQVPQRSLMSPVYNLCITHFMDKRHLIGKTGEDLAMAFLLGNKHKIVSRNFNALGGEIDLITMHKGDLHLVEVKSKKQDITSELQGGVSYETSILSFRALKYVIRETFTGNWSNFPVSLFNWRIGVSYETSLGEISTISRISTAKQQKLERAYHYLLQRHPQYHELPSQFDAIEVVMDFRKKFAIIRLTEQIMNI